MIKPAAKSVLLIKRATDALLDYIFSPDAGLQADPDFPEVVECPFPDCGALCNRSDISDHGVCRYCGGYIAAWLGVKSTKDGPVCKQCRSPVGVHKMGCSFGKWFARAEVWCRDPKPVDRGHYSNLKTVLGQSRL